MLYVISPDSTGPGPRAPGPEAVGWHAAHSSHRRPPWHELILFSDKIPPHNRFSTHFFSMKMAELGGNMLVSSIIDFDDIQLCLRQFCLNLNICKVMTDFLIFLGQNLKKIVITLQILRFKQYCLRQS